MSAAEGARGTNAVARFLRPRSIAVIGISTRAGSAGQIILQCLKINRFAGEVHLVGRTDELIDGRRVLKSADELPEGVDLAVFTLPAAAVCEAIEACARRKVGTALVFAAGFAETGDHATQDAIAATTRAAGLAVVGPNCLGVTNNVDGIMLHMLYAQEALRGVTNGVAIIGQSGGLLGHFQRACDGRGIPLSYVISTGNEAGLDTTDFLDFLVDDPSTRVIVAYCEELRRPQTFLAALRRARAASKPVVLMLVGRSVKARKAAQSHTGALVSDFATVRTQVEDAGSIVVTTMDETMDLVAILQRFPVPPAKGPGILTASGAYVALTNDLAEEIGLDLPELEPTTLKTIKETLPSYGNFGNPLDTTAGFSPEMLPVVTKVLIDDPNVGMLFISFPIRTAVPVKAFNEGMAHSSKPKVMVALGDTWPLADDVEAAVKESPAVFSRSSDRMLRAIALYTRYGRNLARPRATVASPPIPGLPKLGRGAQPEWLAKKLIAAAGIRIPDGALARTAGEAATLAKQIGYPVVLKAQAASLPHKTEVGGVALNLINEAAVRAAWDTMMRNVKHAAPNTKLDGALIEKMSPRGIELMVGAMRDPGWGTVLLLGLGGIWVEALGDVQVLPATADKVQIIEALGKLRAAKLLIGMRGAPPADLTAVAEVVLRIGGLMRSVPEITEIDINPLTVHAKGEGATALDALIIVG
ncbi:MAG: acetate--CoA ligase family protein [Xanthobacteraceae bacterium]